MPEESRGDHHGQTYALYTVQRRKLINTITRQAQRQSCSYRTNIFPDKKMKTNLPFNSSRHFLVKKEEPKAWYESILDSDREGTYWARQSVTRAFGLMLKAREEIVGKPAGGSHEEIASQVVAPALLTPSTNARLDACGCSWNRRGEAIRLWKGMFQKQISHIGA